MNIRDMLGNLATTMPTFKIAESEIYFSAENMKRVSVNSRASKVNFKKNTGYADHMFGCDRFISSPTGLWGMAIARN